jgi:hypothetical protein
MMRKKSYKLVELTCYTYLVYRSDYIYVGKGTKDRAEGSLKYWRGTHYYIVFESDDWREARRMEDYLYMQLKRRGYKLLNRRRPGRYRGEGPLSEETKQLLREINRRPEALQKHIEVNLGNTHSLGHVKSEDSKMRCRETNLVTWSSVELRSKHSFLMTEKMRSEEVRKRIVGRVCSTETKALIASQLTGNKHTLGLKHSEETCRKNSESKKRGWSSMSSEQRAERGRQIAEGMRRAKVQPENFT